jgi:hypothetical protein
LAQDLHRARAERDRQSTKTIDRFTSGGGALAGNHGCNTTRMSKASPSQFTRLLVDVATVRPFFAALLAARRDRVRSEPRVPPAQEFTAIERKEAA